MSATASPSSRAAERRSRAFICLLADICRQFPDLRAWLLEDFARDADTRANFLALVTSGELDAAATANGFAELAGELNGWRQETQRLQRRLPVQAVRPFGGLTWDEMEALVRKYQARTIGLPVFLLARDWRKAGEAARTSPKFLRAGADFLDTVIRAGDTRSLAQLGNAVKMLRGIKPGRLRTAFGHSDWWKLHALVYMLRNPRPAYRTRDVRAHLAELNLRITSLDFRRFCKRHDIARDERSGRPRTRDVARSARR